MKVTLGNVSQQFQKGFSVLAADFLYQRTATVLTATSASVPMLLLVTFIEDVPCAKC